MIFNYHPKLVSVAVFETRKIILALILLSLCVFYIYSEYIPNNILLVWSLLQVLFIYSRYLNAQKLKEHLKNGDAKKVRLQLKVMLGLITYSAFLWNFIVLYGVSYSPVEYEFISMIVIMGIVSGGIISLSPVFYLYVIYFFLIMTPQIILFLLSDNQSHTVIIMLSVLYIPFVLLISKSRYQDLLNSIQTNERLEDSVEKLNTLSIKDDLTGVYNRRYFFSMAEDMLSLSLREEKELSFLMMDIDYFKDINDKYGHFTGDEVLISFAKEIKKMVRKSDIFARVGGEEFTLLLHHTNYQDARHIAQEICDRIANKEFVYDDENIKVTVSIGVSTINESTTVKSLYQDADLKLYDAKSAGRNRVC